MTAERDELARIIKSPESFDGGPASCGPNDVYADRTADAIWAAGYRRPQQVTTVEELDALPENTVIRDSEPATMQLMDGKWWSVGSGNPWEVGMIDLPATVLHVGGAE